MKKIPLHGGKFALVDDEDYPIAMAYSWHVSCRGYAQHSPKPGASVFMHRFLIDAPEGKQVDHINGDKLDNRKSNLRLCTNQENCRARHKANPSGFRGVSRKNKGWQASISDGKKHHYLGIYPTPELASAAYRGAAKVLFGEFQPIDAVQEARL